MRSFSLPVIPLHLSASNFWFWISAPFCKGADIFVCFCLLNWNFVLNFNRNSEISFISLQIILWCWAISLRKHLSPYDKIAYEHRHRSHHPGYGKNHVKVLQCSYSLKKPWISILFWKDRCRWQSPPQGRRNSQAISLPRRVSRKKCRWAQK